MAWLTGWNKRKEIRYGTTIPGANLTDFPLLLKVASDTDIGAELTAGGGITITDDDGETEVPFGVYPGADFTDSATFILRAKFSLLTAASTDDVIGYIYYDSAETTVEDKSGVVSNGYVVFMPLEEDPSGSAPQMYDWVSETNIGTSVGSMTSGDLVAGTVGNGLDFDGINDYISLSSAAALSGTVDFTVSGWVKTSTTPGATRLIFQQRGTGDFNGEYFAGITNTGKINFVIYNAGYQFDIFGATTITDGAWHHIACVRSGSNGILYVDGASDGTGSGTAKSLVNTLDVAIGSDRLDSSYTTVIVDEFRIEDDRSADWIAFVYENDANNADTVTLGDEESEPAASQGNFLAFMAA